MIRNKFLFGTMQIFNQCFIRQHLKKEQEIAINYCMINYYNQMIKTYTSTSTLITGQYKEMQIPNLGDFKSKNCQGIKYVTAMMQQLFELSIEQVKDLFKKCPKLKKASCDIIEKNVNVYQEAGITHKILLQYPILLTLENVDPKIKYMKELNVDINAIAPMLLTHIKTLKRIVEDAKCEEELVPYGNRIIYMSKLMEVPAPEISEKLVNHTYVLRLPLDRLERILKVLLDYGIDPRNILNDCWALRYSSNIAEERLQKAIEANVVKVKTWMIRCQDKVFNRCINRQVENRKILGSHSTVEEYLSKRLECSLENANYLTEKYPAIMKMNNVKMKEMIDFLYEQDYTSTHVCRVPRILIHSLETTKIRLQQLKKLGYVPTSLAILCKSKKDFEKILKKHTKRKKNAEMKENLKKEEKQ